MFTNLKDALNYIENRRAKHTFEYFKSVLDAEHIDYHLACIHVTGTNGKGGTINFISHILQEAGLKVGTFTSPYIVCHQDRFMINGQMMSDSELLELINQNVDRIEKYNLAMFEIDFIIMLQYFNKQQVDIALIEVGIGGRNDKTNMILPKASIITNVGHDHLNQIGPTIEDVAYEKAGIIKHGVYAFIGEMDMELVDIFEREAKIKNAPLHMVKVEKKYRDISIQLQMEGEYHLKNACMAIEVAKTVYPHISDKIIQQGLYKATWPGRFERFVLNQSILYLDGAHNLEAIQTLLETVSQMHFPTSPTFVYAALQDKDYQAMASMIRKNGYKLVVCQFDDGRALNQDEILSLDASSTYPSIDQAIEQMKNNPNIYIVCGSLHFISQFRNKIIQNRVGV